MRSIDRVTYALVQDKPIGIDNTSCSFLKREARDAIDVPAKGVLFWIHLDLMNRWNLIDLQPVISLAIHPEDMLPLFGFFIQSKSKGDYSMPHLAVLTILSAWLSLLQR